VMDRARAVHHERFIDMQKRADVGIPFRDDVEMGAGDGLGRFALRLGV